MDHIANRDKSAARLLITLIGGFGVKGAIEGIAIARHRSARHRPGPHISASRVVLRRSCCLRCPRFGSKSRPTAVLPRAADCSVQRRSCL
jgi:hypothetical protein